MCQARAGAPAGVTCCNDSKKAKDPVQWLVQRYGQQKGQAIARRVEAFFVWVQQQV